VTTIYLASKSPRRRELLHRLGVEFEIIDANIDEVPGVDELPEAYVQRIAIDKARAGRKLAPENLPILAADTEVIVDGKIFGKPADMQAAVAMLQALSGRMHEVYSAVALLDHNEIKIALNKNRVWFRPLGLRECENYCHTYRPLDKAGAYGVQDKGAGFIQRLEGSYSGVMGLPIAQTKQLLQA